MQCPVCHNEVDPQSTFCNHCGAPLSAAVPPESPYTPPPAAAVPPAYTPAPAYASPPPAAASSSGLSANAAAALAYITIIPAIIFLIIEPYNKIPLVKFHSLQSIGLTVAWVVFWIGITILHIVLHFIPFIGVLFLLIDFLAGIGFFILWIVAILKASKGEFYKLPIIGDFCLKQVQS